MKITIELTPEEFLKVSNLVADDECELSDEQKEIIDEYKSVTQPVKPAENDSVMEDFADAFQGLIEYFDARLKKNRPKAD